MTMKDIVFVIQIIVSVTLISLILLQAKGVGLGRAWGGGGEFYKSKRGVEKIVFQFTIFMVVIFMITSLLSLIVK
jgi:preprotein translocase subunit SecG